MSANQRMRGFWLGSSALALVIGTSAALAQGAAPAAQAPEQAVEQVVVTGSLLSNPNYTAPTPVTAVGAAQIDTRGLDSIGQDISELPFVQAGGGLANNVGGITGQAESFTNLRGLGANRTLVLIDGQRLTPENAANNFDTSLIPSNMIQRFDVVTTGASASYGSDAVAGVVNLNMKNRFEGFTADMRFGISQRDDYDKPLGSLLYGHAFLGGKLHFVIGGEVSGLFGATSNPVTSGRTWEQNEPGLLTLPTTRAAGLPANVFSYNVENSAYTQGGIITSAGALKGIAFDASGNPFNFQYGSLVGGTQMIGTSNYGVSYGNHQLGVPFFRAATMARAEYEIDQDTTAFVSLNYGMLDQSARSSGSPIPETFVIQSGNPYIPAAIQTVMTANNIPNFTLAKQTLQGTYNFSVAANTLTQLMAGAHGRVPFFKDWAWDIKANAGESIKEETFGGVPDIANVYQSANVVKGANGAPACGTLASNASINGLTSDLKALDSTIVSPGCIPYNPFGTAPLTQAQYNYVYFPTDANGNSVGRDELYAHIRQYMVQGSVTGSPFTLPAGEVDLVVGGDYRQNSYNQVATPGDLANYYNSGNFGAYKISESVYEFFGETDVPVLKNLPFVEALNINAAVRYTDYSISGSVVTWKYGATWDINDEFRLRATESQDIRAPNFNDLSPLLTPGRATFTNPISGVSGTINNNFSLGNPNLQPEKAKNFSGGLVFTSDYGWLPGFRGSVDYYRVNISGVITSNAIQDTVNRCLLQNIQSYCNQITFGNTNINTTFDILSAITQPQNLSNQIQDGVDFNLNEHLPLDQWNLPGVLDFSGLASYINEQRTIQTLSGGSISNINYVDTPTAPRWSGNFTVGYQVGALTSSLQLIYYSPLEYSATLQGPGQFGYNPASSTSVNRNIWPSVTQFNLHLAYDFFPKESKDSLQGYLNIDNLLDKDPPIVGGLASTPISNYDTIGRYFRIGLRYHTD